MRCSTPGEGRVAAMTPASFAAASSKRGGSASVTRRRVWATACTSRTLTRSPSAFRSRVAVSRVAASTVPAAGAAGLPAPDAGEGTAAGAAPEARRYSSIWVFMFSDSGPNTACTPLPTRMTPLAPRTRSALSSTREGSLTATRSRVMQASRLAFGGAAEGQHQIACARIAPRRRGARGHATRGSGAAHRGSAGRSHQHLLAAGRLQVEPADGGAEDDVVDDRVDRAEDQHQPPLLGEPAEHVEDEEVDATLREREPHVHAERAGDELRRSREQCVYHVERRRDEQERELDRLGDSGEERGERRRDHDAADRDAILRRGAVPHGDGGRGQAEHLEEECPRQYSRRGIAGEEAVDVTVHHRAARIPEGSHLEEEGHVPDVVQTERDQEPLDEAVDGRG